ncbi:MAG: hypothetical protein AB7H77_04600 [Bdellovibrionales bacterium]
MKNFLSTALVGIFMLGAVPALAAGTGTAPAAGTASPSSPGAVGNPTGTGMPSNTRSGPVPNTGSAPAAHTGSAAIPTPAVNPSGNVTGGTQNGIDVHNQPVNNAASPPVANPAIAGNGQAAQPAADWTAEDSYWRSNFQSRPYYTGNSNYHAYQPAYRYGVDLYNQNQGKPFNELDRGRLQTQWQQVRGNSNLTWDQAQGAVSDAYNRAYDNRRSGINNVNSAPDPAGAATVTP